MNSHKKPRFGGAFCVIVDLQYFFDGLGEVYMMKPDFENMAIAELRSYVKTHSDDEQAFHTYIDRFTSTPTEVFSGGQEEVEIQVKKKVAELIRLRLTNVLYRGEL
jgi:hypothetical protein